MARQIEYDPSSVKQSVLSQFWSKGYAETSLADLEAASGLNRRQLYNGIGDKRAMFLQALDDFTDRAGRQFLAPLEREDAGLSDIVHLLETFLKMAAEEPEPLGCMICSTSQEDVSADEGVAARIDSYFERIRSAYANALACANKRGELELTQASLELRADALFGTHVALCVLARARRPIDQLDRMAKQALDDLR